MGRPILGGIGGMVSGALIAAIFFGALPPFNAREESIIVLFVALGLFTGTLAGCTGTLADTLRDMATGIRESNTRTLRQIAQAIRESSTPKPEDQSSD